MSDLCYNCSTCHLQVGPCFRDLVQCEICYCWGHQYIFCPRGVAQLDENYRYWSLCHNCDCWHLPIPCEKPYHTCGQCGNTGHLEFFCPIYAIGRADYIRGERERQRLILEANGQPPPANHGNLPPYQGAIPQDTITKIKLDAARQAFSMLDGGLEPRQVIAFMAGPVATQHEMVQQLPTPRRSAFQQAPIMPLLPSNFPMQPTTDRMTQTDGLGSGHGLASTYVSMHQRFEQGDLAKTIEHERPMDTMPMPINRSEAQAAPTSQVVTPTMQTIMPTMHNMALKTQDTEPEKQGADLGLQHNESKQQITPTIEKSEDTSMLEKIEKPKKVAKSKREATPGLGPRCAACAKTRKKCLHRAQLSPTPQPALENPFGTPSAATNYLPMSDAPEGYSLGVPALPDQSFALPAELHDMAAVPPPETPPKKKATTSKRKR